MNVINYFHLFEGNKLDGPILNPTMSRASQASILSAAREMNSLEEREYDKKKGQALSVSIKKKTYPTFIGNIEYPKREDMVRASIRNMNIKGKRLESFWLKNW